MAISVNREGFSSAVAEFLDDAVSRTPRSQAAKIAEAPAEAPIANRMT
jgi:hypothetical protein